MWRSIPLTNYSKNVQNYHKQQSLKVLKHVHTLNGKLRLGKQIGTQSSFGKVFLLGDDNMYVLKRMDISTPSRRRIFENEVTVGSMPGISAVGPKIYAFTYSPDERYGEYIMDNFIKGRRGYSSMSLAEFAREAWRNSCPSSSNPVIKDLKKRLMKFYHVTQGYHGDLHSDNIQLIFDNNDHFERVMIFDYGAHKRFKTNVTGKCFEQIMNIINREFKNSHAKKAVTARTTFHPNKSVPMIEPKGQHYRSNATVLKRLNYFSPWKTLTPGKTSLYNLMYNRPRFSLFRR